MQYKYTNPNSQNVTLLVKKGRRLGGSSKTKTVSPVQLKTYTGPNVNANYELNLNSVFSSCHKIFNAIFSSKNLNTKPKKSTSAQKTAILAFLKFIKMGILNFTINALLLLLMIFILEQSQKKALNSFKFKFARRMVNNLKKGSFYELHRICSLAFIMTLVRVNLSKFGLPKAWNLPVGTLLMFLALLGQQRGYLHLKMLELRAPLESPGHDWLGIFEPLRDWFESPRVFLYISDTNRVEFISRKSWLKFRLESLKSYLTYLSKLSWKAFLIEVLYVILEICLIPVALVGVLLVYFLLLLALAGLLLAVFYIVDQCIRACEILLTGTAKPRPNWYW